MASKTKWQAKREASYAALVHAAMRRFHERGYAATTVADIVAGTGYSAGAFYFHFQNKADCFWHVVAYRQAQRGRWWDAVLDQRDAETSSLEDVLGAAFAHFAEVEEGAGDWVLVMVDFHAQHRDDPDTQARLTEVYARWHDELVQFVAALDQRGWIPPGRDHARLATQLFAYAEGLTTHHRLYQLDDATVQAALLDGLARILRS